MKRMHEETNGAGCPEWHRLARLREEIDDLDASLVDVLAARYRLIEEVGSLKGSTGLTPLDPQREAEIVRRAGSAARDVGLPEEGVRQLFWVMLDYCREGVRVRHDLERARPGAPVAISG